jgi:hypothetical protein
VRVEARPQPFPFWRPVMVTAALVLGLAAWTAITLAGAAVLEETRSQDRPALAYTALPLSLGVVVFIATTILFLYL